MKCIKELLSEKGSISSLRVMSLICVLAACGIALMGMLRPVIDYSGLSLLCGTFLGAGFGGKVMQKKTEVKEEVAPESLP
jgi:hypothetical protein